MARKPKPAPASERQALAKAALIQAGGRRISLNLPPELAQRIAARMDRDNVTQTEVILRALKRV